MIQYLVVMSLSSTIYGLPISLGYASTNQEYAPSPGLTMAFLKKPNDSSDNSKEDLKTLIDNFTNLPDIKEYAKDFKRSKAFQKEFPSLLSEFIRAKQAEELNRKDDKNGGTQKYRSGIKHWLKKEEDNDKPEVDIVYTSGNTDEEHSIKDLQKLPQFETSDNENLSLIKKHVYFHVPPPDSEEVDSETPKTAQEIHKHYKIIFIKAPSFPTPQTRPASKEEKTFVYVLVKKPEDAAKSSSYTIPSRPEVFFIKYGTKVTKLEEQEYGEDPRNLDDTNPVNSTVNDNLA